MRLFEADFDGISDGRIKMSAPQPLLPPEQKRVSALIVPSTTTAAAADNNEVPSGFEALATLLAASPSSLGIDIGIPDRVLTLLSAAAAAVDYAQQPATLKGPPAAAATADSEAAEIAAPAAPATDHDEQIVRVGAEMTASQPQRGACHTTDEHERPELKRSSNAASFSADETDASWASLMVDTIIGTDKGHLLGRGAHSYAYALPWRFASGNAFVKIAYNNTARLKDEAGALRTLAAAGVEGVPLLIHEQFWPDTAGAAFSSLRMDESRPDWADERPFLILAPRGVPLTSLDSIDGRHDGVAKTPESRACFAASVAADLLAMLRQVHGSGVGFVHGNIKPENVVMVPRREQQDDDFYTSSSGSAGEPREISTHLYYNWLVSGKTHQAMVIDWADPVAIGQRSKSRKQRGYCHDGEEFSYYDCPLAAAPRQDLESVAYVAAAIAHGAALRGEPPPWKTEVGDLTCWRFSSAVSAAESVNRCRAAGGEPHPDIERESRIRTAAATAGAPNSLGPVASCRWAWLAAHPEALGDSGTAFLERVRAGGVLYTFDGGGGPEEAAAAASAEGAGDLVVGTPNVPSAAAGGVSADSAAHNKKPDDAMIDPRSMS